MVDPEIVNCHQVGSKLEDKLETNHLSKDKGCIECYQLTKKYQFHLGPPFTKNKTKLTIIGIKTLHYSKSMLLQGHNLYSDIIVIRRNLDPHS